MNRRTKKLVIVLSAAGALALAAGGAYVARDILRERRAQNGLVDGRAAFAQGNYPDAMSGLGHYISRYPNDPDALLMLARARAEVPMENRRHLAVAVTLARRAVDQRPTDADAIEYVVNLYTRLGFLTETRQYAQRLLAVDPANITGHTASISALVATSRFDEALSAAEAFIAARPDDPRAHQTLIEVMALSGASPSAILDRALRSLEGRADNLVLTVLAARAAGAAGDRSRFDELVARALSLPVNTEQELIELLGLLDRTPDPDTQVRAVLDRLSQHDSLAAIARDLGAERDWKLGRADRASAALRAALADPSSASARALALGILVLTSPDDADLIARAAATLEHRSAAADRYWVLLAQGIRAQRDARIADARERFAEAMQADPRPGFAQFLLADLLFPLGERAEAIRLLESLAGTDRAIVDPAWRVARSRLVTMSIESGRLNEARGLAGIALGMRPALPEVLAVGYATLTSFDAGTVSQQDLAEMARAFASIEGSVADDATVLGLRTWAAAALGRRDEAARLYDRLCALPSAPALEVTVRLLDIARTSDPALHERFLRHVRTLLPRERVLLAYETAVIARAQGVQAARAFISSQNVGGSADEADAARDLILAGAIEPLDPTAAVEIYERLVQGANPSLSTLIAIADSPAAWSRKDLITRAVSLLRQPLGSASIRYRTLESRRLLTFERSDKAAADVVTMLAPQFESDPGDIVVALLLSDAYVQLQARRRAVDILERAQAIAGSPLLYPSLISNLQASGRGPDADRALRRFLGFTELPDAIRRERIRLLAAQGMLAEALADIAALADRRTTDDFLLSGAIRARLGDSAGAAADVERARAASPTAFPAILAAADLLATSGDIDGAVRMIEQAESAASAADRRRAVNTILARFADPTRAEAALRETAVTGSADDRAQYADFLFRRGRFDEAARVVDDALKLTPDDTRLLWLRGTITLSRGGDSAMRNSLEILARAAQSPDASPSIREVLAVMRDVAVDQPDWTRAARRLTEIVEKYPTEVDIRSLLVSAHINAGAPDRAAAAALQAADAAPADPRGARLAAQTLASVGRIEESVVQARAWRARERDTFEPDLHLAFCYLSLNRPADALAAIEPHAPRITAPPLNFPALDVLAGAYAGTGRIDAARDLLTPRLAADPAVFQIAVAAIRRVASQPDRAAAIRPWLADLAAKAATPAQHLQIAQAWLDLGGPTSNKADLRNIIPAAEQARADASLQPLALMLIATAHDLSDETPEAIAAYEAARVHFPDNAILLNNLAYCLVRSKQRPSDAVAYASRAVALAAADPPAARANYMDTLAQAQQAAGAHADALATFTTAQTLAPGMPDLFVGIAEVHLALNDPDKARDALRRLDATLGGRPLSASLQSRADALRAALASR
jgi:tetratricopeptide (TPR) repeat protein